MKPHFLLFADSDEGEIREYDTQTEMYLANPPLDSYVFSLRSRTWYEMHTNGLAYTNQDAVPKALKLKALLLT